MWEKNTNRAYEQRTLWTSWPSLNFTYELVLNISATRDLDSSPFQQRGNFINDDSDKTYQSNIEYFGDKFINDLGKTIYHISEPQRINKNQNYQRTERRGDQQLRGSKLNLNSKFPRRCKSWLKQLHSNATQFFMKEKRTK